MAGIFHYPILATVYPGAKAVCFGPLGVALMTRNTPSARKVIFRSILVDVVFIIHLLDRIGDLIAFAKKGSLVSARYDEIGKTST